MINWLSQLQASKNVPFLAAATLRLHLVRFFFHLFFAFLFGILAAYWNTQITCRLKISRGSCANEASAPSFLIGRCVLRLAVVVEFHDLPGDYYVAPTNLVTQYLRGCLAGAASSQKVWGGCEGVTSGSVRVVSQAAIGGTAEACHTLL